jgi:hypothetical protein
MISTPTKGFPRQSSSALTSLSIRGLVSFGKLLNEHPRSFWAILAAGVAWIDFLALLVVWYALFLGEDAPFEVRIALGALGCLGFGYFKALYAVALRRSRRGTLHPS